MPAWVPSPSFGFCVSNKPSRPVPLYGNTVTPGTVAEGSAVTLLTGAQVSQDIYYIQVCGSNNAVSAANRLCAVDILYDPAGGTSWTPLISDLLMGSCAPYINGGIWYSFPIFIPAGSSVGTQAQGSAATALGVYIAAYGAPNDPSNFKVGTKVITYGANSTGGGTTVTPGTTNDGANTTIGTTSQDHFWWQVGLSLTGNVAWSDTGITCDLFAGNTTVNKLILRDSLFCLTSSEQLIKSEEQICYAEVPSGSNVVARLQHSGSLLTNQLHGVAVYGVVG